MHQDRRIGQRVLRLMMIGDDQLEPKQSCFIRLFNAGNAAVNRDDGRNAVGSDFSKSFLVEAITVFESMRDMEIDLRPEVLEARQKDRGASNAIHVVVAVDANLLPGVDGREDAVDRLDNAGQL